jgi:hypothetical protein
VDDRRRWRTHMYRPMTPRRITPPTTPPAIAATGGLLPAVACTSVGTGPVGYIGYAVELAVCDVPEACETMVPLANEEIRAEVDTPYAEAAIDGGDASDVGAGMATPCESAAGVEVRTETVTLCRSVEETVAVVGVGTEMAALCGSAADVEVKTVGVMLCGSVAAVGVGTEMVTLCESVSARKAQVFNVAHRLQAHLLEGRKTGLNVRR